jgi:transcriptional regulator with XRE-family HTH domain
MSGERFGAFVRRERQAKEIGLREMAKMIGVSPTYLSKVERDEFPPPVEDKVKARRIPVVMTRASSAWFNGANIASPFSPGPPPSWPRRHGC